MIAGPRVTILALAALGLSPCPTFAANLSFTGNLRFLTKTFLTVRLPDGRVIDARLPKTGPLAAELVSVQYKLADQVQIGCKNIRVELDLPFNRYHSLELTQIRFLRAPTPEEVSKVNLSLSWQGGDNLLKPPTVVPAPKPPAPAVAKEFEPVRLVNLANLAKLPSFIADEFAVRTRKPKGSTSWNGKDIISRIAGECRSRATRCLGTIFASTASRGAALRLGFPESTGASDSATICIRYSVATAKMRSPSKALEIRATQCVALRK